MIYVSFLMLVFSVFCDVTSYIIIVIIMMPFYYFFFYQRDPNKKFLSSP